MPQNTPVHFKSFLEFFVLYVSLLKKPYCDIYTYINSFVYFFFFFNLNSL